jgi:hypothetical protein
MSRLAKDTFIKNTLFYAMMIVLIAVCVELGSQVLLFARHGAFHWRKDDQGYAQEYFIVNSSVQFVSDARHVTAKPNFSDASYGGGGVSTDAWGFRRGTHTTDPSCSSVIFIGDSVPFGENVPDIATMPSKVFDRLRTKEDSRCVINAAISSYSLFQAVARYEHEIRSKMKADIVYLQIYDPLSHLLELGPRWQADADWATLLAPNYRSLAQYSAAVKIVQSMPRRLGLDWDWDSPDYVEVYSRADSETTARFRTTVRTELERLHDMIVADGVRRLIVAPVTVPESSRKKMSNDARFALDVLNSELHSFATAHEDTIYIDTIELLKKYPESEVFIDKCCHLTERGNDIVAEYLMHLL